jgi:signal transduction histidine kinase
MRAEARDDLAFDGLVHDLNNVFQTIIDAAELLTSEPGGSSLGAIILRSVDQGRRIVSSMAETGPGPGIIEFELLSENAVAFTNDFMGSLKRPPIQFTRDFEPGLRLDAKAQGLERVLVNLFINAAQAGASADLPDCCVRITARAVDGKVQIAVADNGPGVPPEIASVIFTPRFSTDPAHHSGLGLHIVRSSVEAAGGTVTLSNGAEGGAVFTILLPAARTESGMRRAAAAV